MYQLLALAGIARITAALLLLFVAIPALAWGRPRELGRLEWFWWNLGWGVTILTLAGQLFTLVNVAATVTYLAFFAVLITVLRARKQDVPPGRLFYLWYRGRVRFILHLLERGFHVMRRARRARRRASTRIARWWAATNRWHVAMWALLTATASAVRFYRPLTSANLGYSDTYAHLYLMRLLDEGRQVDPAWGPYPRGMHFLLLTIERLTNIDPVLLMNLFGAFSGVLLTLAVAYAAERCSRSFTGAMVAGFLFATMIGGPSQYGILGGGFDVESQSAGAQLLALPYSAVPQSLGEFDVLLVTFLRQTTTLPQELAAVFVLPAAIFLLDWFAARRRIHLLGYVGCSAAVAAVHSGVVIPLVVVSATATLGHLVSKSRRAADAPELAQPLAVRDVVRAAVAGLAAIAIGSTWMLAFVAYPHVGDERTISTGSHVGSTALFYFPFLRGLAHETDPAAQLLSVIPAISITGVLGILTLVAVVFLVTSAWRGRVANAWAALTFLAFLLIYGAPALNLPMVIEVHRAALWILASAAILAGAVAAALSRSVAAASRLRRAPQLARAIPVAPLLVWFVFVPNVGGEELRGKILDYSGYSSTTEAVMSVTRELEPFTWTFVTYGQEYPLIVGKGFHIPATDFIDRYDPRANVLKVPTRDVFIAVEKRPHHFEVNAWTGRYSRAALEERLMTWCFLYQTSHRDMSIYRDDENVRVYRIERSEAEANRIATGTP